jgi:hypothetical protein
MWSGDFTSMSEYKSALYLKSMYIHNKTFWCNRRFENDQDGERSYATYVYVPEGKFVK